MTNRHSNASIHRDLPLRFTSLSLSHSPLQPSSRHAMPRIHRPCPADNVTYRVPRIRHNLTGGGIRLPSWTKVLFSVVSHSFRIGYIYIYLFIWECRGKRVEGCLINPFATGDLSAAPKMCIEKKRSNSSCFEKKKIDDKNRISMLQKDTSINFDR